MEKKLMRYWNDETDESVINFTNGGEEWAIVVCTFQIRIHHEHNKNICYSNNFEYAVRLVAERGPMVARRRRKMHIITHASDDWKYVSCFL